MISLFSALNFNAELMFFGKLVPCLRDQGLFRWTPLSTLPEYSHYKLELDANVTDCWQTHQNFLLSQKNTKESRQKFGLCH